MLPESYINVNRQDHKALVIRCKKSLASIRALLDMIRTSDQLGSMWLAVED
jgi:hypothetical protein